jgi:REP element-mobilizing transposase RayT
MRPSTTLGAHSQALIFVHLTWATKRRRTLIDSPVEALLRELLPRKCHELEGRCVALGITSDHVHALVQLPQKISVSTLAQHLKGMTSRMISVQLAMPFEWQDGYWAESVGHRELPAVERYLANQRAHHQ